ncbi:MAG: aryl-sulfate sulfotransferase N-terminal domain-containing protein [Saprospiraceae bacterium]|nr:aryl-sulfate sulfotransferase N-terminal domain-containing protein [Saprospiraceae bacterium]
MNFTIKQVSTFLFMCMVVVLLSSCGTEEVIICDPAKAKVELNLQTVSGDYIYSITKNQDQYSIVYNTGGESILCFDLIEEYIFNPESWTARIDFSDGSSLDVPSIGNIITDFEHNPFNRNPLSALATINAKRTGKIRLTIKGKFGDSSDFVHLFDDLNTDFELPIFGLYQDYENVVEIAFLTKENQLVDSDTLIIPTPKLENLDPVIEIIEVDRANMEPGEFHLVSSLSYWGPNIAYMFDTYGEIR